MDCFMFSCTIFVHASVKQKLNHVHDTRNILLGIFETASQRLFKSRVRLLQTSTSNSEVFLELLTKRDTTRSVFRRRPPQNCVPTRVYFV